jgi:hypothetical protein
MRAAGLAWMIPFVCNHLKSVWAARIYPRSVFCFSGPAVAGLWGWCWLWVGVLARVARHSSSCHSVTDSMGVSLSQVMSGVSLLLYHVTVFGLFAPRFDVRNKSSALVGCMWFLP